MNAGDADALVANGLACEARGDLVESARIYAQAAAARPSPGVFGHLLRVQMQLKQFEDAYRTCKAALKSFPGEPAFHLHFARLKEKLGGGDAARDVLRNAAALFPENAEVLVAYASALIQARAYADVVPALERLVVLQPSVDTYRALSKFKRNTGDAEGARRVILEARERYPLDTSLATDCARFDPAAAERSHAAMRAALPGLAPSQRSHILHYLTGARASAKRQDAGLAREGAADWSDLVRWSDAEGLSALIAALEEELRSAAPRPEAVSQRGCAAIGQMDWEGAENWFAKARARPTNTVTDVTTFDLDFHRRLAAMSEADIAAPFPPVVELIPQGAPGADTIFIACDPKYFELFVPRFLSSLGASGSKAGVHIHVMDGEAAVWDGLAKRLKGFERLPLGLSAEASGARARAGVGARDYYHAARFVRFHQFLLRARRPAWMMDVDTDVEADPAPTFRLLDGYDCALTTTPIALEPWAKIRAGIVGLAPTQAGLDLSRLVAAIISHWWAKGSLRWGIDQLALFAAYAYLSRTHAAPRTRFLGEEVMNVQEGLQLTFRPITDTTRWEKNR